MLFQFRVNNELFFFGMANFQSHYFTSQDSGVLQVYSVLITRDTIQFLKFSKTDQSGEGSTIVILELPPPPRP